ncbi:hypothetical protein M433DRAFT_159694 [Acidomyces richmondensis BFW]|nr:hypothetical protein M433DRAFT_159694 [Acidomyces richmondensis BFW]
MQSLLELLGLLFKRSSTLSSISRLISLAFRFLLAFFAARTSTVLKIKRSLSFIRLLVVRFFRFCRSSCYSANCF